MACTCRWDRCVGLGWMKKAARYSLSFDIYAFMELIDQPT